MVYLHYAHAIGLRTAVCADGRDVRPAISEGAICNMLARARGPLLAAAAAIAAAVTASPVVCSDETSARVTGKTWWEWVFVGTLAVLHVIRPSRGKAVVQRAVRRRPADGVGLRQLGSQRGHAVQWQMCLAHLLRDTQFAIECGDSAFSAAFKRLLLRAIAIGRRRDTLTDATLAQYRGRSGSKARSDDGGCPRRGEPGRKLRRRIAAQPRASVRVRHRPRCPGHQQRLRAHLRPSVIFRKVTNGFRSEWGAETYAAFRSVVSTAKANRIAVLAAVRTALLTQPLPLPG